MSLAGLVPLLDIPDLPVADPAAIASIHAVDGIRPLVVARMCARRPDQAGPIVIVTASGRRAENLAASLAALGVRADVFPSWETLPHEHLSPRADTMARRTAILRRLVHPEVEHPVAGPISVLLIPVRAFLQPVEATLAAVEPVRARVGDHIAPGDLVERLVAIGYERTDMVAGRGDVAVRGGIVDVFSPIDDHPVRIEFFGDDIDEVRSFTVADQRTIGEREGGLWAPVARELLLTPSQRERAAQLVTELSGAADMLEMLSQGIRCEGMEALLPALSERLVPVSDFFPAASTVVIDEPEKVRSRAVDLVSTTQEFAQAAWHAAAAGGKIPVSIPTDPYADLGDIRDSVRSAGHGWIDMTNLPAAPGGEAGDQIETGAADSPKWRGRLPQAVADLGERARAGWTILLIAGGPGSAKRLATNLSEEGLACRVLDDVAGEIEAFAGVNVVASQVLAGFELRARRLLVLTERDLTGREVNPARPQRSLPSRRRGAIVDPLALSTGDLVVHEKHGIGRFIEMTTRSLSGVTREYLVIEYQASKRGRPADRLFVPTDSLDLVTRYTGSDQPTLSKMGGADWARTKAKVRKATREIAAELIRLYAARQASTGHAFGPDTPWQAELEGAFAYVETPDQLVTIDEVKADMEKPQPMDRLLCGDVGYGKTEVAVRAAFKAVQDGKQVAVLVPTTLLAQQHYETFTERYAGFPVRVEKLSRFSSPAEAERVKAGLADGSIDVVIGTHALVSGAVIFKDLGFVIIDEEQRFGVEHKEALKALRTNVDVLSMSATPIPRTLEMAITGIREMSTLLTPPEERHPVLTYVGPSSSTQIKAAIRREMLRDGQVFVVHNRVASIDKAAARIASLVPDARIAVAHGKMSETQLESVMVDFWNHDYDVLVCTTIVETGLDIANANTLIIEGAEKMGLSQLHQLRGRVGRGRERAYAYMFYDPDRPLTETAHERLSTIAAQTDLGAGTAVAQKDLEIRGAGNLLGDEQSGHIAGVGFDLYVRMVAEAVANFRDGTEEEEDEHRLEIAAEAHIPPDYIPSERLRLEIYAKISAARTEEQFGAIAEELTDRYGPLPAVVTRLLSLARLREQARALGITEIVTQGKYLRLSPVELADSQRLRLLRLHPGTLLKPAVREIRVPAPKSGGIAGRPLADDDLIAWIRDLLANIITPFGTRRSDDAAANG
nr:transcription-repair coupling factor [Nanchangia anserum]